MGAARDLMIGVMDRALGRPVAQGELSLVLAGAELLDLFEARAATLDGTSLVPGQRPTPSGDPLLDGAVGTLVRDEPFETVEDWLWRRGQGLAGAYLTAFETEGLVARPRGSWLRLRGDRPLPVDSPARLRAAHRWAADEPVLATLATFLGLRDDVPDDCPPPDEAARTVFGAVVEALTELDAVRRRRAIENAAFANVWRGA
ncbi:MULTISPECIES: GPP34 family phosphoprotein [unclassified Streptomyces]|uniref:GPP34 family phosphoprotein n=1 Tax=unclassified Streptomyces TaxID=2593676 RepID=UPI00381D8E55